MELNRPLDLTPQEQAQVVSLVRQYLPGVEVWVHGSRVRGVSRPESDLDLVVFAGPPETSQLLDLADAFEESDLPFVVDIARWEEIPEGWKTAIIAEHAVLQERTEAEHCNAPQQGFDDRGE